MTTITEPAHLTPLDEISVYEKSIGIYWFQEIEWEDLKPTETCDAFILRQQAMSQGEDYPLTLDAARYGFNWWCWRELCFERRSRGGGTLPKLLDLMEWAGIVDRIDDVMNDAWVRDYETQSFHGPTL